MATDQFEQSQGSSLLPSGHLGADAATSMERQPTGLLSLPVEILHAIHILSGSASLPFLNHYSASLFTPSTSLTVQHRTAYIIRRLALQHNIHLPSLASTGATSGADISKLTRKLAIFLDGALTLPVCDLEVLHALERRCNDLVRKAQQAGPASPCYQQYQSKLSAPGRSIKSKDVIASLTDCHLDSSRGRKDERPFSQLLAKHCPYRIDIPKRIFRSLPSVIPSREQPDHSKFDTDMLPLLNHLFAYLHANPDSSRGYPLSKAVLSRHFGLIHLLLDKEAKADIKDYLPVMLAIGRNDLQVVRMLIERDYVPKYDLYDGLDFESAETVALKSKASRKRRTSSSPMLMEETRSPSPGKRQRLEDRIKVTSGMLELAVKQKYEPLIAYFLERGAVPNMRTLSMLSG